MKQISTLKSLIALLFLTFSGLNVVQSQCTVSISATNQCLGDTLKANLGLIPSVLNWKLNGSIVSTSYPGWVTNATTVAGGNGAGSGNNQLYYPQGIALDASNNVYVADYYSSRIIKWAPGGSTGTTVAGGNGYGSAANQITYANGVAVDAAGNVYVSDLNNHRVQKWAVGASAGTTVAGGNGQGSAANQLNTPYGLFIDASNNLYIADESNHRVQKWAPGAVTGVTVAGGNGQGAAANQLSNPGGVFVDASGNVYVADISNHRVQMWASGASTGTTVAGGNGQSSGANQLNSPTDVYVDGAGNVYVDDNGNYRVQMWPVGATSGFTIAGGNGGGSSSAQIYNSGGFAFDASHNMYVSDNNNHKVSKFALSGINNAYVPSANGNYVAAIIGFNGCTGNSPTFVVNATAEPIITVSVTGGNAICAGSSVSFTSSVTSGGASPTYNWLVNGLSAGGSASTFSSSSLHTNDQVSCIVTNSSGCAANSNNILMNVTTTPSVSIAGSQCIGGTLTATTGITPAILTWKLAGNAVQTVYPTWNANATTSGGGNGAGIGATQLYNPYGMCLDAAGNTYIADYNNHRIQKFAPGSTSATAGVTVAGGNGGGSGSAQLYNPYGVAVDAFGNIYVADYNNHRVQKWAPGAGVGVTVAGGNGAGSAANQLYYPSDVKVDASGNVYVLDEYNHRVQKWTPGAVSGTTVAGGNGAGSGADQLYYPGGLFVDGNRTVYVADQYNHRVQKWTAGAVSGTTVAGGNGSGSANNQLTYPTGVFVDGAANVYVADNNNHRIAMWPSGSITGMIIAGGHGNGSAVNQFYNPWAVCVDSLGTMYVADNNNSRIQKFSLTAMVNTYLTAGSGSYTASITSFAGCSNTSNTIVVGATLQPTVSISRNLTGTLCTGTSVTYTAAGTNGGGSPSFNWFVNGSSVQNTASTTYTAALANNSIVWCVVTNSASCSATSNSDTIHTTSSIAASVTITAAPGITICSGTSVTFTAVPGLADPSPSFQWKKNGSNVGSNLSTYTNAALANGDIITCVLTSSVSCASPASAISNALAMVVNTTPTVSVSAASQCLGDTLKATLNLTPAVLNWKLNGSTVSSTYPSWNANGTIAAGGNGAGSSTNQLYYPQGVALDAAGNVYVADYYNNKISKWVPGAGVGVSVAGGNGYGSAANQITYANGVAVDAAGNVYVSDLNNYRVQKWAVGASVGTTVAGGNGQGANADQLNGLYGICLDAANNVYIADQSNHRVQMWAPGATSGVTVAGGNGAGSAANQLNNPEGVYVDAAGNVYVADASNHRVQKWTAGASSGTTVAGGNGAGSAANQLNAPASVYVDGAGNVYVDDNSNYRVQMWAPLASSGVTIAGGNGGGSAPAQIYNSGGLAFDASNNLYVSDYNNHRVSKFALSGINKNYVSASAGNYSATAISFAGCTGSSSSFTVNAGAVPTISIAATGGNSVCAGSSVAFTSSVSGAGGSPTYVWKVNGVSSGAASTFSSSSLNNGDIVMATVTGSGCSGNSNSEVITVNPAPTINITGPQCIGGTLTANMSAAPALLVWKLAGSPVQTANPTWNANATTSGGGNGAGSGATQLYNPYGMTIDAAGNVYVSDYNNHRVQRFAPGSTSATAGVTVAGGFGAGSGAGQLYNPYGVAVDGAGNVYVADYNNHRIQKWAVGATSGITVAGGNGAGSAANQLYYPADVKVDGDGNIYVLDEYNHRVQKFPSNSTSATNGTTVAGGNGAGAGANQLYYPGGLFVDGSHTVYVADQYNHRVQKWTAGAVTGTTVAGGNSSGNAANQLTYPTGVFVDGLGDVYVADNNNNRIQLWSAGAITGVTIAGGHGNGSAVNQLYNPWAVCLDASGNLYVADNGNHRIQKSALLPMANTYVASASGNYTASVSSFAGCTTVSSVYNVGATTFPTLSISRNLTGTLCTGTQVTYTANATNGGVSPTFNWFVNGVSVQNTTSNLYTSTPANNAVVYAVITNSASCSATSNSDTIHTASSIAASVTITAAPGITICSGMSVTFTAVPGLADPSPSFQWKKNGSNVGSNLSTYTNAALANGDIITCVLTSSVSCASPASATSNALTMVVNTTPAVSVSAASQCLGDTLKATLNLTPAVLNWKLNGSTVSSTYPSWNANSTIAAGGNGAGSSTNQLYYPQGVALDAAGNVYVADYYNNKISKWVPGAGVGVSVAGGNGYGSAANQITYANGVAVDAAGNVYVSDLNNYRVQRWAVGASVGTTVAGGNGQGANADQLNGLYGICLDAANNVYIADQSNHRVQMWAPGATSGVTVAGGNGAGSAANQLNNPEGVYVDAAGNVYVADASNHRVQKWAAGASSGTTVAGGNGAGSAANQLNAPASVYVDGAGNVYVDDNSNYRVQMWAAGASSGVTIAGGNGGGSAPAQIYNSGGFAFDAANNLYVSDYNNHRVSKFALSGINKNYVSASAGNYSATAISFAGCTGSSSSFTVNAGAVPTISITATGGNSVCAGSALAFTSSVSGAGGSPTYVWKVNGVSSGAASTFSSSSLNNGDIVMATVTGSGCSGNSNSEVITVNPAPTINITGPQCIGGTLTANMSAAPALLVWKLAGSPVQTANPTWNANATTSGGGNGAGSGATQLYNPYGMTIDAAGNVYVSDYNNHRVQRFAPGSTSATAGVTVAGGYGAGSGAGQLYNPYGVAVDGAGNVYVADYNNHRIQKWAVGATSGITVAGGNGAGSAANQLYYPADVKVDGDGNIYVLDEYNHRVQKFPSNSTSATNGTTVAGGNGAGAGANQLYYPGGLFVDGSHTVYVADQYNHRVQKWTAGAVTGTTVAGGNGSGNAANQLTYPTGVFVDGLGDVYVADNNNNRIQLWSAGAITGVTIAGGHGNGSAVNQLYNPWAVCLDASGNLYVADNGNHRIQKSALLPMANTYVASASGNYTASVSSFAGCTTVSSVYNVGATTFPTLSISRNLTGTLCTGTQVTYTANATNGGVSPTFNWFVNGVSVQNTTSNLYTSTPANNAVVYAVITNSASCSATSNSDTIHTASSIAASVTITAAPGITICSGMSVTFTAVPGLADPSPSFQWKKNGSNVGSNLSTYTNAALANGDIITCVLTSSVSCASPASATSNALTMVVNTTPAVSVSAASQCLGDTLKATLNLTPAVLNWKLNGSTVSSTYPSWNANSTIAAGGNGAGSSTNQLYYPQGVALDAAGNVYVADYYNNKISKWVPGAGVGVSVAGGNGYGSAANQITYANGVAVDAAGNVYVSDLNNYRVQRWAVGASVGTTVAGGNGQGANADQLNGLYGICLDAANNVYIADQSNHRVQMWAPGATSGVTVAGGNGAGSAANQLNNPEGVYVDAAGNVYVADASNHRVQKWAAGASSGTTVAGGNGAGSAANQLNAPASVYVDGAGNVYVDDNSNYRVQMWAAGASSGVTIAGGNGGGSAPAQIYNSGGFAFDAANNLYVSDYNNHRVSKFALSGINKNYVSASAGNYSATAISFAGCTGSSSSFTVNAGAVPTISITATGGNSVCAGSSVAFTSSVSGAGGSPTYVWKVNGVSSGAASTFSSSSLNNGDIVMATVTGSGCSGNSNSEVISISNTNVSITGGQCIGGTLTANINTVPAALVWKLNGSTVQTVYPTWNINGVIAGGGNGAGGGATQLYNPYGIRLDQAGNKYIADYNNHRIQKFPANSTNTTSGVTVAGGYGAGSGASQLYNPYGVGIDALGNVYVADYNNHRVQKWAPGATSGITVAGGNGAGSSANQLYYPSDVTVDGDGNIYVVDQYNHRVQKFPASSTSATNGVTIAGGNGAGGAANQLYYPSGIVVNGSGALYIADEYNHRIQKWAAGAIAGTTVAGGNGSGSAANQLTYPTGAFVDGIGDVFVADNNNHRIQQWAPGASTGVTIAGGNGNGSAANQLYNPWSLAGDTLGNLYVVDDNNHRIEKIRVVNPDVTYITAASGNFTASASSFVGCTVTSAPFAVGAALQPSVTIAASPGSSVCSGASVVFTATGTNGGASPTFDWQVNGVSVQNSASTTYTSSSFNNSDAVMCIMSGSSCSVSSLDTSNIIMMSVQPTLTPTVSITANPGTTVCAGTTVGFTAVGTNTGGIPSYQWFKNGSPVGSNSNIYSTNTYNNHDSVWVVMTSSLPCASPNTATSSHTIMTINALPSAAASNTGPYCSGDTIKLSSTGGISYAWSATGFTSSLQNPKRANAITAYAGVYTVNVTDANNCSAAATTTVVVNQESASITPGGPTTFCTGDSVVLSSGSATAYAWSTTATTQSITAKTTGTYSVSITDSHGCTAVASQVVNVLAIPSATAGHSSPTCQGGNITLTSNGGTSYNWISTTGFTSNLQNPTLNAVTSAYDGTYTVTVSNGTCNASASTTITVGSPPSAGASNTGPYCAGSTISLSATGGVSYSWSGPNGFSSSISNPTRSNAPIIDSGIYTVTVTSALGCTATATTNVNMNGLAPTITAGGPTSICAGSSVTLDAHPTGTGFTYLWSTNATTPSISVNSAATYIVTVTSPTGCSATASQTVTVNPLPTVTDTNAGPYCIGYTIDLSSSGTNINSYNWSGPNGFSSTLPNPTIPNSVAASFGTYHVTVTSSSNCTATASTTVAQNGTAPYFSYSGNPNYTSKLVYPDTGSAYTSFRFEITYYSAINQAPAANYPRLELDFDHNGNFTDANDRLFIMQESDPSDHNYADGKTYFYVASGIPSGTTYQTTVIAYDNSSSSCYGAMGPISAPTVLQDPDLTIFANDITFSVAHPDTSQAIQVCAVVHNYSDYPAVNFVNHLRNQFDTLANYGDITVPYLAPHSQTTICWNIMTPNVPSWNPMQVTVNSTHTFNEANFLDNEAIRPFVCGQFILPGDIQITGHVTPQTSNATSNNWLTICGDAIYRNTAVKLANPSCAGATVTITVPATGATYTGYTNSLGQYCITFLAPVNPGLDTVLVTITDYTLDGDTTAPFALNGPPCMPDLYPGIALNSYQIIAGQSVTGTYNVGSVGCANVNVNTLTTWTCPGASVSSGNSVTTVPFNAGNYQTFNFPNLQFNTPGTYTLCVNADASNNVVESNENNTYCRNITVLPACPDLVASVSTGYSAYQCQPTAFGGSVYNVGGLTSPATTGHFTVTHNGIVKGTLNVSIPALASQAGYSASMPFTFDSLGYYYVTFSVDTVPGECNVLNNSATSSVLSIFCNMDLVVQGCSYFDVTPIDPLSFSTIGIQATVTNAGVAPVVGPFVVRFNANGTIVDTTITGNVAAGASINVHIHVARPASPGGSLTVIANATNSAVESDYTNNTNTGSLCYDFIPSAYSCGGTLGWLGNHVINQPFNMGVFLYNQGLYKASTVHTLFEISGPGLPAGYNNLGFATTNNVFPTCYCPYYAALPTAFACPDTGYYTIRITADYDNRYAECNEGNNVIILTIHCSDAPDYQVLSQYIAPSLLNPAPGQPIDVDISYYNIGQSDVGDSIKIVLMLDNDRIDSVKDRTLATNDHWSVRMPHQVSSNIVGVHVLRAILNDDYHVIEDNHLNNEATRAYIVGEAPNLYFSRFRPTVINPTMGQHIAFNVTIPNQGDQDVSSADVQFKYIDAMGDTVLFYTQSAITVNHHDSISFSVPWIVQNPNTYVFAYIINTVPTEYRYDDNMAVTQLGALGVSFTGSSETCIGYGNGSLTVHVVGEHPPFIYSWSNGSTDSTITAGAGFYTVQITDIAGNTTTIGDSIRVVTDVIHPLIGNVSGSILIVDSMGICPYPVSWSAPVASDNCGLDTFYSNYHPGDSFPSGITTVTYTARDKAGNVTTASFTVTIIGTPLAFAGNDNSNCNVDTLGALAAQFGVGTWSVLSGAGTFSNVHSPTAIVSGMASGINTYLWQITNGTCGSSRDTVAITNTAVTPDVVIFSIETTQCVGAISHFAVSYFAGGGTTPHYQWFKNGNPVGPDSVAFQTSALATGDSIWVVMTSNAPCRTATTDTSNKLFITRINCGGLSVRDSIYVPLCGPTNSAAIFAIPSGGTSPYTYSWNTGATTASLTGLSGGTRYSVTVTDHVGATATVSDSIPVPGSAPVVIGHPANSIQCNGIAPTYFASGATGVPTPTVQWQKSTNGGATFTNIAGATSSVYNFTPVQGDYGNQYRAVYTNSCGADTTFVGTLLSGHIPIVTTDPLSQTVCAGGTATFMAAGTGGPNMFRFWQYSTDSGATFTSISGSNSDTLSVPNVTAIQNGYVYRVIYSSICGRDTSAYATLTTGSAPVVIGHPANSIQCNGIAPTYFASGANGVPTPTVQWQKSTNGGATFTNIAGATSSVYNFTPVQGDYGNQYRAVYTNSCGADTTFVGTLLSGHIPIVTTDPLSQTVCAGGTATFIAAGTGGPNMFRFWQYSTDSGATFTSISGSNSDTLSVPNVTATKNGYVYRVIYSSICGRDTSAYATLTTGSAPVVIGHPANSIQCNGIAPTYFASGANGVPTPTVQWQKSTNGGATFTNIAGATSSVYNFTPVQGDYGNQYRAVYTNSCGADTTFVGTLLSGHIPIVTTDPLSQTVCAGGTATFMAAGTGGPNMFRFWQYSTDSGATFTSISGSNSDTLSVPNVTATKNGYVYRVIYSSICGRDTSAYATLTTGSAPVIIGTPGSFSMCLGGNANFSASASGTPNPTVQWQLSTNGGATYTNIAGSTSTTLSFTPVAGDNGNMYRAIFTNTCGTATTTSGTLTVRPVSTSTVTQSICQGSSYAGHTTMGSYVDHYTNMFGCDSARTLNLTVNPKPTSTLYDTINSGSSVTVGSQTFNSTGTYVVTITGGSVHGCDSTVTLNLYVSSANCTPSVGISASTTSSCIAATFTAIPTNSGANPTYQWYKNGLAVASGTSYSPASLNYNDSIWVKMTAHPCTTTLIVSSLKIKMNGAQVNNPVVNITANNTNLNNSGNIVLTATPINAGTSPYYNWYKNGVNIAGIHGAVLGYGGALGNGDQIYATMTTLTCGPQQTVSSNVVSFSKTGSTLKEITALTMPNQIGSSVINSAAATVTGVIPTGNRSSIHPLSLFVSPMATYGPSYAVSRNFTGPVTYTVTAQDGSTKVWTVTITDPNGNKTNSSNATGMDDATFFDLKVYPDPASAYVMIATAGGVDAAVVTILDIDGRVMYHQELPVVDYINHLVDVSGFAGGAYTINITQGQRSQTRQFVVTR